MSFVPYQVDHSVKNVSRTVGFSKKKVLFKFGIASRQALSQGLTGPDCRGSEHEVVLVWSLTSGKRQLIVDGRESHYSESGQNGWTSDREWQHMFELRVPTMGKFRALFISQPVNREMPNSRPFDLRVGGVSYFNFNQIFQLGTPAMIVRGQARSAANSAKREEIIAPEERRQLAQAKLESLRDLREREEKLQREKEAADRKKVAAVVESALAESAVPNREEATLISFDDDPPAPTVLYSPPVPSQFALTSGLGGPISSIGSAPQMVGDSQYQQFASSITLDTHFDQQHQPPYQSSSSMMMLPYGQPAPAPPAPAYPSHNPYAASPYAAAPAYGGGYGTSPQGSAPHVYASAPTGSNVSSSTSALALTTYQPPVGQPAPSPYALPSNQFTSPSSAASSFTQPQAGASYGGGSAATPPGYGFAQPPPSHPQAAPTISSPPLQHFASMSALPGFAQPTSQQQQQSPFASTSSINLTSPGGVQSLGSYGSAPTFAQPPPQHQQQQQQQSYPYVGGGATPPNMYGSSFASPPTTSQQPYRY